MAMTEKLTSSFFSVKHLRRYFGAVQAVDDISFSVKSGETLGIVGESGCGKSTTARLLVGLIEKDAGEIIFEGKKLEQFSQKWASVFHKKKRQNKNYNESNQSEQLVESNEGETSLETLSIRQLWAGVQMVFQDSYASLNPRLTIEDTIAFGPKMRGVPKSEAHKQARDLLARVGLVPDRFAGRYPHELSGGQRQRVNIIRALVMRPKVIILDEATSALDKSVEAQVLNLLSDFKQEFDLTYIFITHDLNVARYICDRIMVMYLGQIVEIGPVEHVGQKQAHPYSSALFAAMPSMDPKKRITVPPLAGDPPNPVNPPSGCRFHTRCQFAEELCATKKPLALPVNNIATHFAACHRLNPASGHSGATGI